MTEDPVIALVDFNFNYILDETLSTNPICNIETVYYMHQLIDQPTRVDDKSSTVSDIILTPRIQHSITRVQFLNIHWVHDRYWIYTDREFENI